MKWNPRILGICIISLLIIVSILSFYYVERHKSILLKFTISMEKYEYKVNETINITIKIRNNGYETVNICEPHLWYSVHTLDFEIETPEGYALHYTGDYVMTFPTVIEIPPHQEYVRNITIVGSKYIFFGNDYISKYNFTTPGEYSVRGIYRSNNKWCGESYQNCNNFWIGTIYSNLLTFRILGNEVEVKNDGMPDWYESEYGVQNGGWQEPAIFNARYAVNVSDKYDIKDALDEIASKITVHDSLFITIIAHGSNYERENGGFFIIRSGVSDSEAENNPSSQRDWIDCDYSHNGNLGEYLNTHFGGNNGTPRKYAVMTIVIQSCDSGSFISNLKGDHRIIITATQWNETAWTEVNSNNNHWAFLYEGCTLIDLNPVQHPGFIKSMGDLENPRSVYYMYSQGNISARYNYAYDPTLPGTYADYTSSPMIVEENIVSEEVYL